jgi:hypothetical protein
MGSSFYLGYIDHTWQLQADCWNHVILCTCRPDRWSLKSILRQCRIFSYRIFVYIHVLNIRLHMIITRSMISLDENLDASESCCILKACWWSSLVVWWSSLLPSSDPLRLIQVWSKIMGDQGPRQTLLQEVVESLNWIYGIFWELSLDRR